MNPYDSGPDSVMTTHEFFAEIIDQRHGGPGVRPLSRAGGVTENTAYRWGREVMSDETPDGTGAPNPLDRLEALVRMLSSYPRARPILLRLEAWTRALFDQVLHRQDDDPDDNALLAMLAQLAKSSGETVAECLDGEGDWDEDLAAAIQLHDVAGRLVRILEHRADHRGDSVAIRRVS